YIDTAAMYGGSSRWSQRYIGQVMKKRRGEAFLASKTHDRSRDGSLRLLDESLRLLQTDHLDLWQLHNLDEMGDVDRIFAKDGAI
ncbi:MAG TPA: aldo/keto reductase, partial [Candidatus Polarisedimenticolia bacterium]|nr:aldo/keto reductase [Candidatus Polarisedimenticolia bacterium]